MEIVEAKAFHKVTDSLNQKSRLLFKSNRQRN